MAIDDEAVRTLQIIGLRQGRLTAEDLKQVLPVDAMSAERIAQVILRLQDAGIDVEVDEDLLSPRHPPRPNGPMAGEAVILPADRQAPAPTPPLTPRGAAEPKPSPPEPPAQGGGQRASRAVMTAIILVVIVLAVIAALIAGS